jgi:histone-lysine N-methyltransferase SETMAR
MGFQNIITGDESWFYLQYPPLSKWVSSDSARPVAEVQTHYHQKVMFTVCFSGVGIQLIHLLPPKVNMNAVIFVEQVLCPIEKLFSSLKFPENAKLFVHYDNATAHVCKFTNDYLTTSTMERLPHPPYSPDISPCDFFLFGYLKHLLAGKSFSDGGALKEHIESLLKTISPATWQKVFSSWIERLDFVIESGGKYWNKKNEVSFSNILIVIFNLSSK